jgi:hypothetical protein
MQLNPVKKGMPKLIREKKLRTGDQIKMEANS